MIPAFLQVHITDDLDSPSPPASLDARTYTSYDGKARLHIDPAEFDCYIECTIDCDPSVTTALARGAARRGWQPIPEEEMPAEMTPEGWVRIWLEPVDPIGGDPCMDIADLLGVA